MMPTIRIDEDVFAGLKELAEPFTDTPNTVIRRLLQERREQVAKGRAPSLVEKSAEKSQSKSPRVSLTPQTTYETYLLYVLAHSFNGRGEKHEVTRAVVELMDSHGLIGNPERQHVSTGESRAENTVAWGRNALKERGLISRNSPRGVWELTPEGLVEGRSASLQKS